MEKVLGIREYSFTERLLNHWNSLLRAVLESPSLEVLKQCVDLVLRNVV